MFTGPWEVIKVRWGEWPAESNSAHQIGYCKPKQQKFLSKNSLPAREAANSETLTLLTYPGFLIVIYDTSTDQFWAVVLM